jgi:hypothetical protein
MFKWRFEVKKVSWKCTLFLAMIALVGCTTTPRYQQADQYTAQIRSMALLPLVIGDENGTIEKIGRVELQEFIAYFNGRFFDDFEDQVRMIEGIELKLPGRDFNLNAYNGMDYFAVAHQLGVDAVLGINLTLYNEVKPGAKGAQIAGAVVTTLLLGGYVTERQVVGYQTQYSYLDVEKIGESLIFRYSGKAFPTIEEQRQYFVDTLLAYIDRNFPLSADYIPAYLK